MWLVITGIVNTMYHICLACCILNLDSLVEVMDFCFSCLSLLSRWRSSYFAPNLFNGTNNYPTFHRQRNQERALLSNYFFRVLLFSILFLKIIDLLMPWHWVSEDSLELMCLDSCFKIDRRLCRVENYRNISPN